jgi:transcriptional regulator with XRE-family HTH domain
MTHFKLNIWMNEGKIVMDIEVYTNFFCVGIKNYTTKQITYYEISEQQNDIHKVYNYFKTYNGFLITFNGIHYDNLVIKYILMNYQNLKDLQYENICGELKYLSDKIIGDIYDDEISKLKWFKTNWTDIDLFCYWSKMLRISKKISLKSLAIQLGYDVVQELPYKPDSILTLEDLPKLRTYNTVHDLTITELLCSKMEEEIKLRANINKDYKLDCWSWDAPKIASEALLQDYCRITRKNVNEVRKQRFEKPVLYLGELLKNFNPDFKLPIFQKLWSDVCNSTNSFSQDLIVNHNNTSIKLSYGIGGLHSVNNNECYYTDDLIQIKTSDVALKWRN